MQPGGTDDDGVPFGNETVAPEEKTRRVAGVFASVAGRYDLMNDLMSAGAHRAWKAGLIDRLNPQPADLLIDVAGGTGDVARGFLARSRAAAARRGLPHVARAIVADINPDMLAAGRRRGHAEGLSWICADAAALPFPDRTADAVSIAFGIRNVARIEQALAEFRRVLRPGGRFACLEFSRMRSTALQEIYDRYSFGVIPELGRFVTGDRASYQYLVESIRRFPDQETFAAMVRAAGFAEVRVTDLAGGAVALHTGWAV
jgi:demethylmenaquinone methyltransferase/2-methoxy-6-polyprenyl-1,4-benzoquinol methylase